MQQHPVARRFFISGRVQGVGFRFFVERVASALGLCGYVRNLDDGRVEVYAIGDPVRLAELRAQLCKGPRLAHVHHVREQEAPVLQYRGFHIE